MSEDQAGAGSAYAQAGVDIDQMADGLKSAAKMMRRTRTPGVRGDLGAFGGLFAAPGAGKLLVASTDGVGTKLNVAVRAGRHDTVGQDLVNHCVNDILVQGAKPLFFLDYVGTAQLEGAVFQQIMRGLCQACRENRCALLGGETAEMPGLYPAGEYDLVGTIVGVVDEKRVVTGRDIRPGDIAIGLPSSGLHTNGYSLARKVCFDQAGLDLDDRVPGMEKTVAQALLAVHRSYLRPVRKVLKKVIVRGMAHITGGGLRDNLPRILPPNINVAIDGRAWTPPPLFRFLQETGGIAPREMYRVFNMGIGFVLIVRPKDVERTLAILKRAGSRPILLGYATEGHGKAMLRDAGTTGLS